MGRQKALLPLGDRPLITHIVDGISSAGINQIYLVTGHQFPAVRSALAGRCVQFIHNDNYEKGEMLSSVQTGVHAARGASDGFFVALGDCPFVLPETYQRMMRAYSESNAPVLLPTFEGKRGHPVLIDSRFADEILALTPDQTLHTFTDRHRAQTREVPVPDPAVRDDVDDNADYLLLLMKKGLPLCPSETKDAAE